MISQNQVAVIMPNLSAARLAQFFPHLEKAMKEFEINTLLRAAAFLAQLAHESAEFRFMEEIWGPTAAQKRYEPVTSLSQALGNTQTGDGKRFKGRGPIQLTGRANYRRYGNQLGIDLENNPLLAATPEIGFRTAGLFWKKNGLNELADKQFFKTITKRINGGLNGFEDRLKYYVRAKNVLLGDTKSMTADDDFETLERAAAASDEHDFAPEDTGDDRSLELPAFTRGAESVHTEPEVKL